MAAQHDRLSHHRHLQPGRCRTTPLRGPTCADEAGKQPIFAGMAQEIEAPGCTIIGSSTRPSASSSGIARDGQCRTPRTPASRPVRGTGARRSGRNPGWKHRCGSRRLRCRSRNHGADFWGIAAFVHQVDDVAHPRLLALAKSVPCSRPRRSRRPSERITPSRRRRRVRLTTTSMPLSRMILTTSR